MRDGNSCSIWVSLLNCMILCFLISTFPSTEIEAQSDVFRVIKGVPHLPVYQSTGAVSNPSAGMLIYSVAEDIPVVFDGHKWSDLASLNIPDATAEDYFVVKSGIPYLPGKFTIGASRFLGAFYYSIPEQSVMIFDGSSWVRIFDLKSSKLIDNKGFAATKDEKTLCLPLFSEDPSPATTGDIYINSKNRSVRYFNGVIWKDIVWQAIVKTFPVSGISGEAKALSGGEVVNEGGSSVFLRGICWGYNTNPDTTLLTKTRHRILEGEGLGMFSDTIKGLTPGAICYVRAYAVNGSGIIYGGERAYQAPTVIPAVITLRADPITSFSTGFHGKITSDGGGGITAVGFIYSSSGDPLPSRALDVTDRSGSYSTNSFFSNTAIDLWGGTLYNVRAFAKNAGDIGYGDTIQFRTRVATKPVLGNKLLISENTGSSVKLLGNVVNDGGSEITGVGVMLSTDGLNYSSYSADVSAVQKMRKGNFDVELSDLLPRKPYFLKAYATNVAGTGYGRDTSFVTIGPASVYTVIPGSVSSTSAESGADIRDNGGTKITVRGLCWDVLENPTIDSPNVIRDTLAQEEDGIGIFPVGLTNLSPGRKYYLKAFAVNGFGISYGSQETLTSLDYLASVVTKPPTSFFRTTNYLGWGGGSVTSNGGSGITDRGVCWSTSEDPAINRENSSSVSDLVPEGTGDFQSCKMDDLLPNVPYHIKAYATNLAGTVYGGDSVFVIIDADVSTLPLSSVACTEAVCGGEIGSIGNSAVSARGITWSDHGDPLEDISSSLVTDDGSGIGSYPSTLNGLMANHDYFYRAYARISGRFLYGDLIHFKTPVPSAPKLNSSSIFIKDVTDRSAVGWMEILNNGGAPITKRGMKISEDNVVFRDIPSELNGQSLGQFSCELTDLKPGVTYFVKGYAENSEGLIGYSSETSFMTASLAGVSTVSPQAISPTKAKSGGIINDAGNSKISARGICWSSGNNPTKELLTKTEKVFSEREDGLGAFADTLIGLSSGVKYYVRAYAVNGIGISYGNLDSLTVPVLPVVETLDPAVLAESPVLVEGNLTNDGGAQVLEKGFCWGGSENPDIITGFHRGAGTGVGSFSDNLTLAANVTYHVRAYARNLIGLSYGEDKTFAVKPKRPVVLTTIDYASVNSISARVGGRITSDGESPVFLGGIIWSEFGDPLYYDSDTILFNYPANVFFQNLILRQHTDYYARSFAQNAVGTSYGDKFAFSTPVSKYPEVVLDSLRNITGISAYAYGKVVDNGNLDIQKRGVCWSASQNPTLEEGADFAESAYNSDCFAVSVSMLNPGTVYYARAYAQNALGVSYSNSYRFATDSLATVKTYQPTNVSYSSANVSGYVGDEGGDVVTSRGFCWGFFPEPIISNSDTIRSGRGKGYFSASITNLLGNTRYYVRAFAINPVGIAYGKDIYTIDTKASTIPSVATLDATNNTGTTILLKGNITDSGGATVEERGFYWSTDPAFTVIGGSISCGPGTGAFSSALTGLTMGDTYYFRAYASNKVGSAVGNDLFFIAGSFSKVETSATFTAVTATSASGGGKVLDAGNLTVTNRGLCWNTTGNPVYPTDHYMDRGDGIGEFFHTMTWLMANTTYHVRAYAVNLAGTAYGEEYQFTTLAPTLPEVVTLPLTAGPNGVVASGGGTIVSNGGVKTDVVGVCWSTVSGFDPDTVKVNKTVQVLDSFTATSFTSQLSGLTPRTKYFVRAFAKNSEGVSYSANELSFTTNEAVELETFEASAVTSCSAFIAGKIKFDGGGLIRHGGLCWDMDANPDINKNKSDTPNPREGDQLFCTVGSLKGGKEYHFRVYVLMADGSVHYGEDKSFITSAPVRPTIFTNPVVLTSATSANGYGTISSDGGGTVRKRGFCWSTTPGFVVDQNTAKTEVSGDYTESSFILPITDLIPDTKYFLKAYVENEVETAYGNEVSFWTPKPPVVNLESVLATGNSTATCNVKILDNGRASIDICGVAWSTNEFFDPATETVNRKTITGGTNFFVCYIDGLQANTRYYACAFAGNVAGAGFSNRISFKTDEASLPYLLTLAVSDIGETTATSGGNILRDGGATLGKRGVVWSLVQGFAPDTVPASRNIIHSGSGEKGVFTSSLSGLKRGTTYYVKAYVENVKGIAYGAERSFTTLTIPSLIVQSVTCSGSIASYSCLLASAGGQNVTETGVCWSKDTLPDIGLETRQVRQCIFSDHFSGAIAGLQPATKYHLRAYGINSLGVGYSEDVPFTTPPAIPTVTTESFLPYSRTSVAVKGFIPDNGGATVTERGVVWSSDPHFDPDTVIVNKVQAISFTAESGGERFNCIVPNMKKALTYYVRTYAVNSAGTAYGNQIQAFIIQTAPELTTLAATAITGYSASSGAEITKDGGADILSKGICWDSIPNPSISNSNTPRYNNGAGPDSFTSPITGLKPNTQYWVRAYAQNEIGVGYGTAKSFLTNAYPVLVKTTVSEIGATIAIAEGEISDDGRTPILERGFCWSKGSEPTVALTTKTIDRTTTGIGTFTAKIRSLDYVEKYYVRAYATNGLGTSYGSLESFTTSKVTTPIVTTTTPTHVDGTLVTCGGNVDSDGGVSVSEYGVCWSLTTTPLVWTCQKSTTPYSDPAFLENGFTYVNNLSSLKPGTPYYMKAYATNGVGTAYGDSIVVTTESIRPAVGAVTLSNMLLQSNLSSLSADGLAIVTSNGGASVIDRGFYWNTTGVLPTVFLTEGDRLRLGAGDTDISGTLTGLSTKTTYYIWAFATNIKGTCFGPMLTYTTPTLPILTTTHPSSVARYTSSSGGNVSSTGGIKVTKYGVCYSRFGIPTVDSLHVSTVLDKTAAFSFTSSLSGLSEGTQYYLRAYATNALGTGYGNKDSLTTCTLPMANTAKATLVTSTGATSGGKVISNGGATVSARGVCWSSNGIPDISVMANTKTMGSLDTFSGQITTMANFTTYYIRAYATNLYGTGYGLTDTIKTLAEAPTVGVTTLGPINETTRVAAATAKVTSDGGEAVSCGFCWNTTGNPVVNNTTNGDRTITISGTKHTNDTFTGDITGLAKEGIYHIRAYAINSADTVYSTESIVGGCPETFNVFHLAGEVAPEDKQVTYHSVYINNRCWLTQNLGADTLANSATDGRNTSAGWYWQFNRVQGYKYDTGKSRIPSTAWNTTNETNNWELGKDPCSLLLGAIWSIPTKTEWSNVIGSNGIEAGYASPLGLRLHPAGFLYFSSGDLNNRGGSAGWGAVWSNSISSDGYAYGYALNATANYTPYSTRYGFSLRCVSNSGVKYQPLVDKVTVTGKNSTTATCRGAILSDGGGTVTERGFSWNTTGNPVYTENHIAAANGGLGSFTETITGLDKGATYHIRAYAITSTDTVYGSEKAVPIDGCPILTVEHKAGSVAPKDKTVTYNSVAIEINGEKTCWLTQNLGADRQANSATEDSELSSGWYWQFNHKQGYTRGPVPGWTIPAISDTEWGNGTDPCNLLLGSNWTVPSKDQWVGLLSRWSNLQAAYSDKLGLELHAAGGLDKAGGGLTSTAYGLFWSSTSRYAACLYSTVTTPVYDGAYGFSVRCILEIGTKVGSVTILEQTENSVACQATVTSSDENSIIERGFCWNTTGATPDITKNDTIHTSKSLGAISGMLKNLNEVKSYYVWAYAIDDTGTTYSRDASSFKICPAAFTVTHTASPNGAPVDKSNVTYHSISSTLSGSAKCWLTQNLGADQQATPDATDASEASAGWYWQFNRSQGYKHDGVTRTPVSWVTTIPESGNWLAANDPCNVLLGLGWRIPTDTEWTNAYGTSGGSWGSYSDTYKSVLKLHAGGYLDAGGSLTSRGGIGRYWSSVPNTTTNGNALEFTISTCAMATGGDTKTFGLPVRCIRDALVVGLPSISNVTLVSKTDNSATVSAVVNTNGGSPVSAKGLYWNTTGVLPATMEASHIIGAGAGVGSISGTVGIVSGTMYYAWAFATNDSGTTYSPVCILNQQFSINGVPAANVTTDGDYTVIKFTGSGTFTVTGSRIVNYMMVGGGGGGGGGAKCASCWGGPGGGGGAGGYLAGTINVTGSIAVVIGAGGTAGRPTGDSSGAGTNGGFSSLTTGGTTITAKGGGRGGNGDGGGCGSCTSPVGGIYQSGTAPNIVSDCGSGGGAGYNNVGGIGTSGQGNNGGNNGYSSPCYGSGGGGGSGGVGSAGTSNGGGGNGGAGVKNDILVAGIKVGYAGGGGGGTYQSGTPGGATDGGGAGALKSAGQAAMPNTGGGGGGGDSGYSGGAGSSGIIIIRYLK